MNSKLNELKEKSKHLPETPGVYLMKNNQGEVIYVGKAKNLKRRVSSYFMNSKNRQPKIERMITRIDTFEVKLVPTELEALLLERRLIHQLRPMNNRQMNKFERYKYLSLINKPNLKIEVDGKMNGVYSLGPFRQSGLLREVERIINETYLLKPEGEWVHQIRFVAKKNTTLLPEEKEEELFQFFQGKVDHLLARLKLNMEYASQEWQFKWAGQYLEDQKTIDEFMQLNKHLLEFAQITGKYFKVEEGNQVRYLLLENGLVAEIAASFEHFKPQQTTKLTGISKADLDEMMILSSFLKNHPEITLETL